MILCIGEILADVIATQKADMLDARFRCGGAPFNVAVHAKRAGGAVGFVGRVGQDSVGNFIRSFAAEQSLDYLDLQVDPHRNTTLAFVTLDEDGERDFTFLRHECADYHTDVSCLDTLVDSISAVHLGSLMLSEQVGQQTALKVAKWCKNNGKKLSFDINYRQDIFECEQDAIEVYRRFADMADYLKLSLDEALMLTDANSARQAAELLASNGKLVVITLGSAGSYYFIDGRDGVVSSQKVKAVDTTGAGDAFWGTFLARLDGATDLSDEFVKDALRFANKAGAQCALKEGAI